MITVRPATLDDLPSMAAIRAREWETEPYWLNRIGNYLRFASSSQPPPAAVFVAVDDAAVAGFVAGHRTRRHGCDGELEWINVVPERRGQGIAQQLVVSMGQWFAGNGLRRICVNVEPDNARARALYARFGAEPIHKYWLVWEDSQQMCTVR